MVEGKPTGVVRVSLGAMSTAGDVDTFLAFIRETFVGAAGDAVRLPTSHSQATSPTSSSDDAKAASVARPESPDSSFASSSETGNLGVATRRLGPRTPDELDAIAKPADYEVVRVDSESKQQQYMAPSVLQSDTRDLL